MNWKNIKTVLIVILAAVNLFFTLGITLLYRSINAFDDSVIDDLTRIMASAGINVKSDAIPRERVSTFVYKCEFSEDYYDNVAQQTGNSLIARRFSTPSGADITLESGDRYSFTEFTGLSYRASGFASLEMPSSDSFNGTVTGYSSKKYRQLVDLFISKYTDDASTGYKYDTFVESAYYDNVSQLYFVSCKRHLDGLDIIPQSFICALNGDTIVAIDGELCFNAPSERYSAQLTDQINIMFIVKEYLNASASAADNENASAEKNGGKTITVLELCYCTSINDTENTGITELFYMPGWKISYDAGDSHIFNAADGTIYTEY